METVNFLNISSLIKLVGAPSRDANSHIMYNVYRFKPSIHIQIPFHEFDFTISFS